MKTTAPAGLALAPRSAAAPLAGLLLLLGGLVFLDLAIGPDLVLADLFAILHPEATTGHPLHFFGPFAKPAR
jgi:hypothetical protein